MLRLKHNFAGSMSHEANAVMQCLRVYLSPGEDAHVDAVLKQQLDWQELEERAESLRVAPIVEWVLLQHAGHLAPPEVLQRWNERLTRLARKNLLWLQEWQRLLQAFDQAGIPAISFKGPALALTAYRNLGLREFHDLDFLIHPQDVVRARKVLLEEGYSLWSSVVGDTAEALLCSKNRQLCFTSDTRGTAVDLHWGLLHEMFSFRLDVNDIFDAARIERYEEGEFFSISPEHLLLYLCGHGMKNCWSNLSQLCDVATLIQTEDKIEWNRCLGLAEEDGCNSLLNHTLLLCERILEIDLPETVKQRCRQDKIALAISKTAEKFLCLRGENRPGYSLALKYHLAFAMTLRDRVRLVFFRVFAPSELDWHHVKLPRCLFALYYLLRPLRFLQEQTSRLIRSS